MAPTQIPNLEPAALARLLAERDEGVLATIKRDGRPQLSNVGYRWDEASATVTVIAADFRAKTRNLLRDPRASLHVTNREFTLWLVAEGETTLSAPCRSLDDEVGRRLVRLFAPDGVSEAERQEHLTAYPLIDRRLVELRVHRVYGGNATKALSISFDPQVAR